MRTTKLFSVMVGLAFCLSFKITDSALAHGGHFHSLEELQEHIESHMSDLEEVLSQKPLDPALASLKRRQIIEHGKQYLQTIQQLAGRGAQYYAARWIASWTAWARTNRKAAVSSRADWEFLQR